MRAPKDKLVLKAFKNEVISTIIAPTDIEYYEVVAVGSEVKDIKVGEKVFYHLGAKLVIDGQEYVSVTYNDIQVIL